MKNYSELTVTEPLHLKIELEAIGNPEFRVAINDLTDDFSGVSNPIILEYTIDLLDIFTIDIELYNKLYSLDNETAVIINNIIVDNIEIIPKYDYLAEYINDHNNNNPTHYLGFNGKWTLTIDRPFYHWLHHHSGQGWLLD